MSNVSLVFSELNSYIILIQRSHQKKWPNLWHGKRSTWSYLKGITIYNIQTLLNLILSQTPFHSCMWTGILTNEIHFIIFIDYNRFFIIDAKLWLISWPLKCFQLHLMTVQLQTIIPCHGLNNGTDQSTKQEGIRLSLQGWYLLTSLFLEFP